MLRKDTGHEVARLILSFPTSLLHIIVIIYNIYCTVSVDSTYVISWLSSELNANIKRRHAVIIAISDIRCSQLLVTEAAEGFGGKPSISNRGCIDET